MAAAVAVALGATVLPWPSVAGEPGAGQPGAGQPGAGQPAAGAAPVSGAEVFASHCAVCHGPEAAGIPGSFPSLRDQIAAFGKSPEGRDYLVMVVTTGLMGDLKLAGVSYRGVMPAQSMLSETEVAAVLSYLAGDRKDTAAGALTPADVTAARDRHADRSAQATRALRPAFPEQ